MLNTWGLCEYRGLHATEMTKWDSYCNAYSPKEEGPVERCCANCAFWLTSDEHLVEKARRVSQTSDFLR
jgi:hypothetical protein